MLSEQQVRFAPLSRRREQQIRAERLLSELEQGKTYPYQYVCFRVTEFRPESYPDLLITSEDLAHDLRLLIQQLAPVEPTAKAGLETEAGTEVAPEDPVLTLEEVGRQLNVSTKTVRRWRKFGLVGQRVLRDGRVLLGFRKSVVDHFVDSNHNRVERGSKFTQMTECEREQILHQARELSHDGSTLTEVSRQIAQQMNRSPETIRYTIKNFDREHPDQALFPKLTGPLDAETKQMIYSSYRRGIDVDTLAKRFQRTRTSMYRVINEVRAQHLLEQPLDYVYHASFEDLSREAEFLAPMPGAEEYERKAREMKIPRDVPAELIALYEMPLLNKDQEQHLFRQMNYLKHKASKLCEQLRKPLEEEGEITDEVDPTRVRIQVLKEIEELLARANAVKERLVKANMRLVVTIAKRHSGQTDNFFELVSDGNMSLLRAVEKFDFGRGFKFSTYASWAIMKNFARSIPDEKVQKERFVTGHEEVFEIAPDNRTDENEIVASQERASHSVNRLLAYLEPREREIIRLRAGLDDARGLTLEEIGQRFGITKERVRQLNARAMKRLKSLAEEQELDLS
jgi:RNA polymerase sigma factor (sigma-70 family)